MLWRGSGSQGATRVHLRMHRDVNVVRASRGCVTRTYVRELGWRPLGISHPPDFQPEIAVANIFDFCTSTRFRRVLLQGRFRWRDTPRRGTAFQLTVASSMGAQAARVSHYRCQPLEIEPARVVDSPQSGCL